ncbi:GyrI-like domain-containing protein [Paenibacillus sp. FSL K6-1230]|uniref:GyrI-like domain-containing protein n=1 Tax=Paenibacillus sp. FSL K6-1230 TaxID=2921603 RepID=UPI00404694EB
MRDSIPRATPSHILSDTVQLVIVEAPSELIIHHLNKSSYVRYTHVGPESALDETYEYLYQEWIPSQGYELGDYDFEVWGAAYQPESEANKIELYIAIN